MLSDDYLEDAAVYRGGRSSMMGYRETKEVKINNNDEERINNNDPYATAEWVMFTFEIRSKGGGKTAIGLKVGPKDFPLILEAMTVADPTASLNAILGELRRRDERAEAGLWMGHRKVD